MKLNLSVAKLLIIFNHFCWRGIRMTIDFSGGIWTSDSEDSLLKTLYCRLFGWRFFRVKGFLHFLQRSQHCLSDSIRRIHTAFDEPLNSSLIIHIDSQSSYVMPQKAEAWKCLEMKPWDALKPGKCTMIVNYPCLSLSVPVGWELSAQMSGSYWLIVTDTNRPNTLGKFKTLKSSNLEKC